MGHNKITAYVSAIFKKGCKSEASNYRPVSLTCIVCKLLESVVREQVMQHMFDNNLFSTKQFIEIDRQYYSY